VDYTIQRELAQIYGEIERQLGVSSKPLKSLQAKPGNITGDFEKIIREKCAVLTDAQKNSIAQKMRIHHFN